ncbi:MAG: hypothetical protein KGL75_12500 [Acidobacteriota bacterium]|nr:hypothetical protein [Acidobacteriota bacterium]
MSSAIAQEKSAVGAEPDAGVSVLDLLWLLYNRRRTLAIGTAVFTACALLAAILLPSRFTAVTVILPPQHDDLMNAGLLSQASGGIGVLGSLAQQTLGLKNPNDLQVALIESRTVEDQLIQRFDLLNVYHDKRESDARKDLEGATSIDSGLKDGLERSPAPSRPDPHFRSG